MLEADGLPRCLDCEEGRLLPLSDTAGGGTPVRFKAWVCSNPDCGFNIRIDDGELSFGRRLTAPSFG